MEALRVSLAVLVGRFAHGSCRSRESRILQRPNQYHASSHVVSASFPSSCLQRYRNRHLPLLISPNAPPPPMIARSKRMPTSPDVFTRSNAHETPILSMPINCRLGPHQQPPPTSKISCLCSPLYRKPFDAGTLKDRDTAECLWCCWRRFGQLLRLKRTMCRHALRLHASQISRIGSESGWLVKETTENGEE